MSTRIEEPRVSPRKFPVVPRWIAGGVAVLTLAGAATAGYAAYGEDAAPAGAFSATIPVRKAEPVRGEERALLTAPPMVPAPIDRNYATTVIVDLEVVEKTMRIADGVDYTFWTFGGSVPGSFIRVREGDQVEFRLKNHPGSKVAHNIDLHAVTGPGGGAEASIVLPGHESTFKFSAANPGLYVYHCAFAPAALHVANGMYGLILVEPKEGMPSVDREFYVMQGELYTAQKHGTPGMQEFSLDKLLDENPEHITMNGSMGALTTTHKMEANVGETVRIFFGVGGPNLTSSFHVIGEVFDRVYDLASLATPPLRDVQTTLVPPGGATMVEFKVDYPGKYILVDHALSRLEKGNVGFLHVNGPKDDAVFRTDQKMDPKSGH